MRRVYSQRSRNYFSYILRRIINLSTIEYRVIEYIMRYFFYEIKLYLSRLLVEAFRENRALFLIMYLCFAGGMIFGLFFSEFMRVHLFVPNQSLDYIIIVFNPGVSLASLIVRRLIHNLLFFFLLTLFSLTVYFFPLKVLFILYRGYILGAAMTAIVLSYGALGVVNCIILVVPQTFILISCLIMFSGYGLRCTLTFRRYRSFMGIGDLFRAAAVFYLLSLIGAVYELLVIFLVIRPFNLSV